MTNETRPQWKVWLHELVWQEYYDYNMQQIIAIISEDAYNAIKGHNGNMMDIANMVRDIIRSLGSTSANSTDSKMSRYRTLCNADGTIAYILVEMENIQNINRDNWFNRIGLARNKNRLNVHFSVIVPLNAVANDICNELFRVDVGSKIHHLHTYMSLVHLSAEKKNTTL
jgi:hypothetical protein